MKVEEIKKMVPSADIYPLTGNAKYLISYDINAMAKRDAIELSDRLFKLGIDSVVIGVDGNAPSNPIALFEFKDEEKL